MLSRFGLTRLMARMPASVSTANGAYHQRTGQEETIMKSFWHHRAATAVIAAACVLLTPLAVTADDLPGVSPEGLAMTVHKSPTCGCCVKWIDHLEGAGFEVAIEHPDDLLALKDGQGVPARSRSCHTGVTANGYVFEGHVPAKYVLQFLAAPPEGAIGLAVPAMPVGSPGMEMGDRFMPYEVQLLKADGSTEVFARVETAAQQFDDTGS